MYLAQITNFIADEFNKNKQIDFTPFSFAKETFDTAWYLGWIYKIIPHKFPVYLVQRIEII